MVSGDRGCSAITTSLEGGGEGGSSWLSGMSKGVSSDGEDWELSEDDIKYHYTRADEHYKRTHTPIP